MNISFEKTLLIDVTRNIHALFQQGVINTSEREELATYLKKMDYDDLFAKANEIFAKSKSMAAKNISDAVFKWTANY